VLYVPRKKEESLKVPMSETLYNFVESEQEKMMDQLGEHVSRAEVVRRILNVFMYLHMSPSADLNKIVKHTNKFEEFLKEELDGHE